MIEIIKRMQTQSKKRENYRRSSWWITFNFDKKELLAVTHRVDCELSFIRAIIWEYNTINSFSVVMVKLHLLRHNISGLLKENDSDRKCIAPAH